MSTLFRSVTHTLLLVALFLPLILSASAEESAFVSDETWLKYFGVPPAESRVFVTNITTPFGQSHTFRTKEKNKGKVSEQGIEAWKIAVLHDGGPFANRPEEVLTWIKPDGLYNRIGTRKETLLVPRPLKVGQVWTSGDEKLRFDGFSDFETFSKTIPNCAKIVSDSNSDVMTRFYEEGVGMISKAGGKLPFSKVLEPYAEKGDK